MTYAILARQARCAALGFYPGPLDGKDGPRTRKAQAAAEAAQMAKGLPFQHPSGLTRLHIHWTAGGHKASALDRKHYHVLIQGDGTVIRAHPPATRLAHTLNANGGAIGVALCGMAGAVERPFQRGNSPLLSLQFGVLARLAKELCAEFDIPVSRYSVLTHAEIQATLGIKQRGKWDITWMPGFPAPEDPIATGDRIRHMIDRVVLL